MTRPKYIFLLWVLIFYSNILTAQNSEPDSLIKLLNDADQPSEKIEILNSLSARFLVQDPEKSYQFAQQALLLSENSDDLTGKGISLINLAKYDFINKKYSDALNKLYEAHTIFNDLDKDESFADICIEIALVYKTQFQFDKALNELFEAREIFEYKGNQNKLARTLNFTGGVYFDQGNYDHALEYYQKSLNIYEKLGDLRGIANLNNNIGEICRFKNQYSLALEYYNKSIELNQLLDRKEHLAINLDNVGNVFKKLNQFDSAFAYFNKSMKISRGIGNIERVAMASISLAKLFSLQGNYNTALSLFDSAAIIAQENNNLIYLKNAWEGLSTVYAETGKYREAYQYFEKYKKLSDSLYNDKSAENITQLEMNLEFSHEREIKELKQQKRTMRYFMIATGLFGLFILFLLLYGRLKINLKHSKIAELSLQLEQKQLNEEIDYKNRELATSVMYLVRKNELINFISEKLLKTKIKFKKENQNLVQEIIVELQSNIDSDIWKIFEVRFQEVHGKFYDKLLEMFPNLTEKDKKLAALLKLNMTTKDIAAITHQNPRSIEVARTRLRKKMDLSNKEINLVDFLSKL